MIYFKFAVLLLQITQSLIRWMEEKRMIEEGERRIIAEELAKVAKAAKISKQVRQDVEKKTDAEVDDGLRGDFRD